MMSSRHRHDVAGRAHTGHSAYPMRSAQGRSSSAHDVKSVRQVLQPVNLNGLPELEDIPFGIMAIANFDAFKFPLAFQCSHGTT